MNKKVWGVIFSYLLIVVDVLVTLLLLPYLWDNLGQSEYGLYKMLQSTAAFMSVLDFGLGGTITRYIVKFKTEGDVRKQENFMAMGLMIYGILAMAIMVVSVGITFFIPVMYSGSVSAQQMQEAQMIFMVMAGSHALMLFSHAYTGLFAAHERFSYTKASNIVKILLRVGLIFIGIQLWSSAMMVVLVDFLLTLLQLMIHILYAKYSVKSKIKLHKWDWKLAREALVFTSAILIQTIVNQFNTNVANIVLGVFSTTAVIATYSLVLQLYSMYSNFSTAISTVYLPSISTAVFEGANDDVVTQKVIEPSRIQLVILLMVASGFFLYGGDFLPLWISEDLDAVYVMTCILMVASLLNLSQNTITSVLKAKNKLHGKSLILAISTAINFGLTCLLVPWLGAMGAVIGSCVSLIFGYGLALNIYYHKVIHINMFTYYKKTYAGILPATILCLPFGWGIRYINPWSGWLGLVVEIAGYIVVFAAAMYLLGLNHAEKAKVKKVFLKFNPIRKKVSKRNGQ